MNLKICHFCSRDFIVALNWTSIHLVRCGYIQLFENRAVPDQTATSSLHCLHSYLSLNTIKLVICH